MKTFLLYFSLFTGFNKHSMDEGVFPEYIEMVNPPVLVSECVKSFSCMYGPHLVFQASIRVSFLLEVCQSQVKN